MICQSPWSLNINSSEIVVFCLFLYFPLIWLFELQIPGCSYEALPNWPGSITLASHDMWQWWALRLLILTLPDSWINWTPAPRKHLAGACPVGTFIQPWVSGRKFSIPYLFFSYEVQGFKQEARTMLTQNFAHSIEITVFETCNCLETGWHKQICSHNDDFFLAISGFGYYLQLIWRWCEWRDRMHSPFHLNCFL